jgi:hypothetical protein
MIARDRIAGLDAEQIQQRYPYLSLGQIYLALVYCYDHALSNRSVLGWFRVGPTEVGPEPIRKDFRSDFRRARTDPRKEGFGSD